MSKIIEKINSVLNESKKSSNAMKKALKELSRDISRKGITLNGELFNEPKDFVNTLELLLRDSLDDSYYEKVIKILRSK